MTSPASESAQGYVADARNDAVGAGLRSYVPQICDSLAELGDGLCEGCFVNLPKNIVVRLARGTELVQCPSCDRILYNY